MSKVKIKGNASGTGVLTIEAPNTNTDRTITLPDEDITLGATGANAALSNLSGVTGTSGQVMTSDGSGGATMQDAAGGGAWELISDVDITASTVIDVTGMDASLYSKYKIIYSGIPDTNNVNLYMAVSTDGGATFETSSSSSYQSHRIHFNAGSSVNGNLNGASYMYLFNGSDIENNVNGKDGAGVHLEMTLYNMGSTLAKYFSWQGADKADGIILGAGRTEDATEDTAVNAVRFMYSSGSHRAIGSIQLIGLKL